ncbi:MAG TPA: sugar phosphate isomerase/epimerase [Solibacterales bacterium]|nr:sugar phosphate isomerase/epimerase [Bryobacterales bacterium]
MPVSYIIKSLLKGIFKMTAFDRRRFLLGSVAAAAAGSLKGQHDPHADSAPIRLSVATYSFRKFPRDKTIEMLKQLGVKYVDIKEFHLPYKDSPAQLAEGRKELDAAGLTVIGGGNISLQKDDEADLRRYFDYAKACGFPMMIIAPTHETLPKIEKLVKEYNIKVAIHNHGPEDKHFPTPQSVLAAIKNMDRRVGLCCDLGHTARAGKDPVESLAEAGTRLFEIHIKDLKTFEPHAIQVNVGQGIMPVAAIFRQLVKMKYPGVVSLEYEINADNPLPGMTESFAYMRGVIAGMTKA